MPGPSNLTIRTCQIADRESLTALLLSSYERGELPGYLRTDLERRIEAAHLHSDDRLAEVDGRIVAFTSAHDHLLLVDPDFRRQGIGRSVALALSSELDVTDDGPYSLFPPHGMNGARNFLTAIDYRYWQSLWRFELDGRARPTSPSFAGNLVVSAYRDADLDLFVSTINRSFADHPSPLQLTPEQVMHVHSRADFDPENVCILRDLDAGRVPVGICVVGLTSAEQPPVGSIKMLGVLPEYRRQGIGRQLLLWGIERLRIIGADPIELAVEGENETALDLYRSVGFEAVEEWPRWALVTELPQ